MRGRSLRDLHTRGQARRECKSRRDRLPSDVTNLYHGKSIEHLTRFEDRNNVWPKLMVSYRLGVLDGETCVLPSDVTDLYHGPMIRRSSRPQAKNIHLLHLLGGVYEKYTPPIEKSDWSD